MKKRNLVIGLAAFGVVAAIGSSVALYSFIDDPYTIDIGVRTDSDIKYAISDVTTDENNLNPDQAKHYDFNIQGVKQSGTTFTQPYVLGHLEIKLTVDTGVAEDSRALANALNVSAAIGYKDGTYWDANGSLAFGEAAAGTGTEATITGSIDAYMYVSETENFEGVVYDGDYNDVDLDIAFDPESGITDNDFVTKYAECTYTIDITLNDNTEGYEKAYVLSSQSGWNKIDQYEMVSNIEGTKGFEWCWFGILPTNTEFKCLKGEKTWSGPSVGNNKFNEGTTSLYWDGQHETDVTQVA